MHSDAVWSVELSPELQILATCGLDGKVCVMDYADHNNLKILYVIQGNVSI